MSQCVVETILEFLLALLVAFFGPLTALLWQ